MYPCSTVARRAHMSDGEFWAQVYGYIDEDGDYELDIPPDALGVTTPCPVCNAPGACSWDTEGRPLIHVVEVDIDA